MIVSHLSDGYIGVARLCLGQRHVGGKCRQVGRYQGSVQCPIIGNANDEIQRFTGIGRAIGAGILKDDVFPGDDCVRIDAPRYGDYAYVYQNDTEVIAGQQYTIGAYFKDDTSDDNSIPTAAFVHIELEYWDAESGGSPIRMPMPFTTAEVPDDGQWHWIEFVETAPAGTQMISAIMGAEHSGGGA